MSDYIKNYRSNFLYEKFDVDNYLGQSYGYQYVWQSNRFSKPIRSKKGILKQLELGFAPAVGIHDSFEDFLKVARDW